jgi:glycosyltransferase involved in cell wall biosynthesis
VDAVLWFYDEIFPLLHEKLPDLCFKIVGSKPHPKVLDLQKKTGVQVTGEVADVRPYLAQSLALVVPLRSGGGTRLKILEAMAMGRPVISTTVGAEGLEVTPGVDILIANNAAEFLEKIMLLVSSPETVTRVGRAARKLAVENYDWQLCLRGLENLYQRLIDRRTFDRPSVLPGFMWTPEAR